MTAHRWAAEKTILVVEDDVEVRAMIVAHLQECGYRVLQARHAAEAIELLLNEDGVDVLFTDIRMPGDVDGCALAAWVRDRYPRAHIIVTSGDTAALAAARQLCGEIPFFRKPYQATDIAQRIAELLGFGDPAPA